MIFKVYGINDELMESTIEYLNMTRKESEDIMVFDMSDDEGYREAIVDGIRYVPSIVCYDDNYGYIDMIENINVSKSDIWGEYIGRDWLEDVKLFISRVRLDV